MSRVYVASVGYTTVGDHWNKSILDLAIEAGFQALTGAPKVKPEQLVVGNMFSGLSSRQEHLGALVVNGLGLTGLPGFKVEAACASGGMASLAVFNMLKAGQIDSALVVGVEKMRDLDPGEVSQALCAAESAEYTQFFGASFVSLNAMLARLYMYEFDVSRDDLSAFPVLAHRNAVNATHAQFRKEVSYEDVARSMVISDPLRLLDCAPVGDGAAALLLVSEDLAGQVKGPLVEMAAAESATNRFSLYERDDMLDFAATRLAAHKALKSAGLSINDVDYLEVHDAFSVVASLSVEALGLSKKGQGARDAREGKYARENGLATNCFGGLKGRGHPVGATGVYQLAETYLQLAHKAGPNQVDDASVGLAQNVGGVDTTAVVHVLRRS
ncbi:MAG: hypothetical protein HYU39_02385 [Thaumarchaeota archaeon]|nr:hypothetical protein [Nitrososphaerota archaeon]